MVIIPDEKREAEYERRKATGLYTEEELNDFLFQSKTSMKDVIQKALQKEKELLAAEADKNDK